MANSKLYLEIDETLNWESEDCDYPRSHKAHGHNMIYTLSYVESDDRGSHWEVDAQRPNTAHGYTFQITFADEFSAKWFCDYHNELTKQIEGK